MWKMLKLLIGICSTEIVVFYETDGNIQNPRKSLLFNFSDEGPPPKISQVPTDTHNESQHCRMLDIQFHNVMLLRFRNTRSTLGIGARNVGMK